MYHFLKDGARRGNLVMRLVLLILTINSVIASEHEASPSFAGGMFYHLSWSHISTYRGDVSGISTGLGGKLAFYISPNFRIGATGFSSNLLYDRALHSPSSYITTGAGGITMEMVWNTGTFRIAPGIMFGGGSFEQLNIISEDGEENTVNYDQYSSFLVAPQFSVEVPMSNKISVAIMADWIYGNSVIQGNNFGPSLRMGILFTH